MSLKSKHRISTSLVLICKHYTETSPETSEQPTKKQKSLMENFLASMNNFPIGLDKETVTLNDIGT